MDLFFQVYRVLPRHSSRLIQINWSTSLFFLLLFQPLEFFQLDNNNSFSRMIKEYLSGAFSQWIRSSFILTATKEKKTRRDIFLQRKGGPMMIQPCTTLNQKRVDNHYHLYLSLFIVFFFDVVLGFSFFLLTLLWIGEKCGTNNPEQKKSENEVVFFAGMLTIFLFSSWYLRYEFDSFCYHWEYR